MGNVNQRWYLKRLDANGNAFVMTTFDSEEEAKVVMAHYESKGHKQTYWVEKQEPEQRPLGDKSHLSQM